MLSKGKKHEDVNYEEDLDNIDFQNYKGMFYNDDPGNKYQDEKTGAHFEYKDMCRRLTELKKSQFAYCPTQPDDPEDSASLSEDDLVDKKPHLNESRQVFKALQSFCVPQADSRNQGTRPLHIYGTTVKENMEGSESHTYINEKNTKPVPVYICADRHKSVEKKRYDNISKPLAKNAEKPITQQNVRKPTFADLYFFIMHFIK